MVQVDPCTCKKTFRTKSPFCISDHVYVLVRTQGRVNQYSGIVSCAQTILREEGPGAFLKVQFKHCTVLLCITPKYTLDDLVLSRSFWIRCLLVHWADLMVLAGHWAASAVDWHRRVHLLRCAGEDKVHAGREEEPPQHTTFYTKGRVNQFLINGWRIDDDTFLCCSRAPALGWMILIKLTWPFFCIWRTRKRFARNLMLTCSAPLY